jgi:hypothetical protein
MIRKHWHPDTNGMVALRKAGEPMLVSVARLDSIAAGEDVADFYMEMCAALDIALNPRYGMRASKAGGVRPARRTPRTIQPSASQIDLLAA